MGATRHAFGRRRAVTALMVTAAAVTAGRRWMRAAGTSAAEMREAETTTAGMATAGTATAEPVPPPTAATGGHDVGERRLVLAVDEATVGGQVPTVSVHPALATAHRLHPGSVVEVRRPAAGRNSARMTAWLQLDAQVPAGRVRLMRRCRERLQVVPQDDVELLAPGLTHLEVRFAQIRDLPPGGNVADVARADARRLLRPWERDALVMVDGMGLQLRLRRRSPTHTPPGTIRLGIHTRELLNAGGGPLPPGTRLPIQRLTPVGVHGRYPRGDRARAVVRLGLRLLRRPPRLAAHLLDLLLRPLLRAPAFALRTIEPAIGDDTAGIVRLPAQAFPLLGIDHGDQVLLGATGGRRVVARALTAHERTESARPDEAFHTVRGQARGLAWSQHLLAGVAAPDREVLGIQRDAIITVRRRLLPLGVRRLNSLVLPLGALLAAIAAIDAWSPTAGQVAGIVVAVTALEMLPLRLSRRPTGRWP